MNSQKKGKGLYVLIVILCVLVLTLVCYIIYDKTQDDKSSTTATTDTTNDTSNSNTINSNTLNQESANVEAAFNSFVKAHNLIASKEGFDSSSLKQMNCEDAVSADGDNYTLQMFTFKNDESAKVEYQKQKNAQISINIQEKVLASSNNDNYDIYEALMIPNLENSPAASGNEKIYMLYVRKDNYLIMLYQSSEGKDKTSYIKFGEELKKLLNIDETNAKVDETPKNYNNFIGTWHNSSTLNEITIKNVTNDEITFTWFVYRLAGIDDDTTIKFKDGKGSFYYQGYYDKNFDGKNTEDEKYMRKATIELTDNGVNVEVIDVTSIDNNYKILDNFAGSAYIEAGTYTHPEKNN